jgi:hypothetical protein
MHILRKFFTFGSQPERTEAVLATPTPQARRDFENLLAALAGRTPIDLRQALEDAVAALPESASTGPELLDHIDQMRLGLGVAIGRGDTGEDQRYRQLVLLASWLYEELGRPQDTQHAVGRRAVDALLAREQKRGEA